MQRCKKVNAHPHAGTLLIMLTPPHPLPKIIYLPRYLQVAFCWCCHWDAGAVAEVLTEREQLIRWQHSCSTCLAGHSNYSYTSLPKNAIRALFHPRPANETELTAEWELLCYQREILNWVQHFQFHSVTVIMNLSCLCILFRYFLIPFDRDKGGGKNAFRFTNFLLISPEKRAAKARRRDCRVVELLENLVLDEDRRSGNRQFVWCQNGDLKYWSCSVCSIAT